MKALHLEPDRYDQETRALLESVADVDYLPCHDQRELLEYLAAQPYEILLVKLGLQVDAEVFGAAPGLSLIHI